MGLIQLILKSHPIYLKKHPAQAEFPVEKIMPTKNLARIQEGYRLKYYLSKTRLRLLFYLHPQQTTAAHLALSSPREGRMVLWLVLHYQVRKLTGQGGNLI